MFKRKQTNKIELDDDSLIYRYRQMTREQRDIIDNQGKIISKQKNLINEFIKELYSNIKTDKQKTDKLKELVDDYQSLN